MPRFHRIEGDRIVPLDDFETSRFRKNPKSDWIVKRDAHEPLISRELFDAVQRGFQTEFSKQRGATEAYLLTGLVSCSNCGAILFGTRRTRKKVVAGAEKVYVDLLYVCAGTLRRKGRCRQVSLPRDAFERAVLRVLDDEVFREENLDRLGAALRAEFARRERSERVADDLSLLERREGELAQRVADGARRILLVDEALVPEVRAALAELKDQLERVRSELAARQRQAQCVGGGDERVRAILDSFRTMAHELRDPAVPLGRRREVLRRFLPTRNGLRPIQVDVDPKAKRGWRNALRKVTVRQLTTRFEKVRQVSLVAGAVSAEGCPTLPGDDGEFEPGLWLADGERDLALLHIEEEAAVELVGISADERR